MESRAFSVVTLKALDEDKRLIQGVATTPSPDRMGDVVEPQGAEYKLPLPLLLDHNHTQAIGEVQTASVTAKGIRFQAQIAKIETPGPLKDLVDGAWEMAKSGLRRAVSIGFRPIESSYMDNGGVRFSRWDWFELSLVSVPANAEAVFQAKSVREKIAMIREINRAPSFPIAKAALDASKQAAVSGATATDIMTAAIIATAKATDKEIAELHEALAIIRQRLRVTE